MPVSIPVSVETPGSFDLRLEGRPELRDSGIESSGGVLVQFDVEDVSRRDQGEQSFFGATFQGM